MNIEYDCSRSMLCEMYLEIFQSVIHSSINNVFRFHLSKLTD